MKPVKQGFRLSFHLDGPLIDLFSWPSFLLYTMKYGGGAGGVVEAGGDVVEGGDGRHEDAEVGHGQAEQVHVHHS